MGRVALGRLVISTVGAQGHSVYSVRNTVHSVNSVNNMHIHSVHSGVQVLQLGSSPHPYLRSLVQTHSIKA